MNLLPTDEQKQLIDTARDFLRDPLVDPSGLPDVKRWALCGALGWFGVGLSSDRGGVGLGAVEEALLFREIGRSLGAGPILGTLLGARVASFGGRPELAAQILEGAVPVSLAVGAGLSGEVDVVDWRGASHVLVASQSGAALLPLDGLQISERRSIDELVPLGTFRTAGLEPIATVPSSVDEVWGRGSLLVAAMLTGIAEAACAMSTWYATARQQFGRPIGTYQAVKHRCADMAVRAEAAASVLFFAAVSAAEDLPGRDEQAAAARVVAAGAAQLNAAGNVQVHGGIGFTWEHPAHRLVTRVEVLSLLFGSTRHHLDKLLGDIPRSPGVGDLT